MRGSRPRQECDGAPERVAEDADARVAPLRQRVDGRAQVGALAKAERRHAAFALAEGAEVQEQDGEPRVQCARDRQQIGLVRR